MTKRVYYITQASYDCNAENVFEKCEGESQTKPNDTLTIEQIYQRALNGIKPDEKPAFYLDTEIHNIDKFYGQPLDLTDVQELKNRVGFLNSELDEAIKAQNEAKREAAFEAEVKKRMDDAAVVDVTPEE
jgi:uncharacterized small protein (DUF1192 family)